MKNDSDENYNEDSFEGMSDDVTQLTTEQTERHTVGNSPSGD